ncbi:MAG: hypothetical protein ABFD12_02620 [Syntrophorhabdus sp.]
MAKKNAADSPKPGVKKTSPVKAKPAEKTVKKATPAKPVEKATQAKKAAPEKAKTAAAKPASKKAAPAKTKTGTTRSANKKGTKYSCSVCGMVVSVDTVCNCIDVCDLVCCSKPMKVTK